MNNTLNAVAVVLRPVVAPTPVGLTRDHSASVRAAA